MIVLLAALAFGQDVSVTLDPGGAPIELPVLQASETWRSGFSPQQGPTLQVPVVVLTRYSDGESATLYEYLATNASLGAVVELAEPDPTNPGSTRLARRITLVGGRLIELHQVFQQGGSMLETLHLVAQELESCDYAYPGPVETCGTHAPGGVSR